MYNVHSTVGYVNLVFHLISGLVNGQGEHTTMQNRPTDRIREIPPTFMN